MKSSKINAKELSANSVASLPTRPNAPHAFGGSGLTADELKAAFDALPLLIAERFNLLLDDISATDGSGLTGVIKTGIDNTHTLQNMLDDIKSGSFIGYLKAPKGSLAEYIISLRADVNTLAAKLGIQLGEK